MGIWDRLKELVGSSNDEDKFTGIEIDNDGNLSLYGDFSGVLIST